MPVTVLFFGQLMEIAGRRELAMEASSTAELKKTLLGLYPTLSNLMINIAVDTVIITDDVALKPGQVVALLPPFSGG